MEELKFDYGNDKLDMHIKVTVELVGWLWWKKQEFKVEFGATYTHEEWEANCKINDEVFYREKLFIAPKVYNLIQLRLNPGELQGFKEKIVGGSDASFKDGYNPNRYNSYRMNMSSFWTSEKKVEAIEYFVNEIIKWEKV